MTTTAISRLYYDPATPSEFSTLQNLRLSTGRGQKKKQTKRGFDVITAWLEKQDAYTLHRPVRKLFARNLFTVTNVMDVWECDVLGTEAYSKYNDNYRYIL